MTATTEKHLQIVAAVLSIIAAIWFFLSKKGSTVVVTGAAGNTISNIPGYGAAGMISVPGVTGSQGPQGPQGTPGRDAPQTTPGVVSTSASDSYHTSGALTTGTNNVSNVYNYFTDSLSTPVTGSFATPQMLTSNLPPSHDLQKYMGFANRPAASGSGGGCGGSCGGGCGGGKKGCTNTPDPNLYYDGRGNCLSATTATLQRAMDKCVPGNLQAAYGGMAENLQYDGIVTPDTIPDFLTNLFDVVSSAPSPIANGFEFLNVPQSRFGAA